MKLTVSQHKIRVWVFEWVVTSSSQVLFVIYLNCQILLVQQTVILVVVRRSRPQKANKLKLVKQFVRQASTE